MKQLQKVKEALEFYANPDEYLSEIKDSSGQSIFVCKEGLDDVAWQALKEFNQFMFDRRWHPIETAPKDGSWFLYRDERNFISAAFTEDGKRYYGDHHSSCYGNEVENLTHWMPLPKAP